MSEYIFTFFLFHSEYLRFPLSRKFEPMVAWLKFSCHIWCPKRIEMYLGNFVWCLTYFAFLFLWDAFWRMKLNFCDRKLRFYLNFLVGNSCTLQQPPQITKKHWILLLPRFLCKTLQKICILTGLLVTLYPVNMPVLRITQIAFLQKSKFSYDNR